MGAARSAGPARSSRRQPVTRRPHACASSCCAGRGTGAARGGPPPCRDRRGRAGPGALRRRPGCTWCTLAAAPAAAYAGGLPDCAPPGRPAGPLRPHPARRHRLHRPADRGAGPGVRGAATRRALPLHDRAGRLRGDADQRPGPDGCGPTRGCPRRAQHQAARRPGPRRSPAGRGSSSREPARPRRPGRRLGPARRPERAGHGVVVGVVDTGIWPENPSFNGLPQRTPGTAPEPARLPRRLRGGRGVGARGLQRQGRLGPLVRQRVRRGERRRRGVPLPARRHRPRLARRVDGGRRPRRPRRRSTASGFGTTSGMAPAARLAVYKACWTAPDPADDGCTTADTVAAVDRAVADGVDVLNYSVSGSRRSTTPSSGRSSAPPTAGVFVATSAGNDGPAAGTVGARLAVGHHGRRQHPPRLPGRGPARRRPRRTSARWSPTSRCARAGLVLGADVAAPGATPDAARLCEAGSLDAARTAGQGRGLRPGRRRPRRQVRDRRAAGGAGMVLANTRRAEHRRRRARRTHRAPRRRPGRPPVQAYVRAAGAARPRPRPARPRRTAGCPPIAGFSAPRPGARGRRRRAQARPDRARRQRARRGRARRRTPAGRGTSRPVRRPAHRTSPGWRRSSPACTRTGPPARIKSAMMTTAYDLRGPHGPLVEGAGHVDPSRVPRPGPGLRHRRRRLAAGTSPGRSTRTRRQRPVPRGRRPGRPHHRDPRGSPTSAPGASPTPCASAASPTSTCRPSRRPCGWPPGRAAPSGCGSPPARRRPSTATSPAGWSGAATGTGCGSRSPYARPWSRPAPGHRQR